MTLSLVEWVRVNSVKHLRAGSVKDLSEETNRPRTIFDFDRSI